MEHGAITPVTGEVISDKIEGKWVTMSNSLTRASHGLTLIEKRITMLAVAQLDSRRKPGINQRPLTTIHAHEYAEQYGVSLKNAYSQLETATNALYERTISFYMRSSQAKHTEPNAPTMIKMRWVYMAKYHEKKGYVELAWSPDILPHLFGLRKQFTSYQLKQASALRSIYSWKLLELLMRFRSSGWAEYSLKDFAESMGASEAQKKTFSKLRLQIIEPAIKELTEKDNWIIELEKIKKGRCIDRLKFTFKKANQMHLDL